MNGIELWCIIFSAAVLAHVVNAAIAVVVTSAKWYRKLMTRFAVGMVKDVEGIDEETEEGKKILDYIKEDY